MKTFSIILVATSACLISAAPTPQLGGLLNGVGTGVANAGQDAVAEVFKLADGVLNIPGDAIGKAASGDPVGAVTSMGANAAKLAGQLPGDLMKIPGDVVKGMTG